MHVDIYVCDTMVSVCFMYLEGVVAGKITVYDLYFNTAFW